MIRSEIAALLSSYAGAGNSFNQRLDMVRARLLPMGNWRGSKVPVSLNIFSDVFGNPIVTLPRQFNTILAGTFRPIYSNCGGRPIGNINGWGEYLRDGSALSATDAATISLNRMVGIACFKIGPAQCSYGSNSRQRNLPALF
jgi:hypothetical protein